MYADAWPFPRRVFLLDFWRRGKDGIMRLLGYDRVGSWRDPTHCHYPSLVHYLPQTASATSSRQRLPRLDQAAVRLPTQAPAARWPSPRCLIACQPCS